MAGCQSLIQSTTLLKTIKYNKSAQTLKKKNIFIGTCRLGKYVYHIISLCAIDSHHYRYDKGPLLFITCTHFKEYLWVVQCFWKGKFQYSYWYPNHTFPYFLWHITNYIISYITQFNCYNSPFFLPPLIYSPLTSFAAPSYPSNSCPYCCSPTTSLPIYLILWA